MSETVKKVLDGDRTKELWEATKAYVGVPTKVLTQAEYDALSDEDKVGTVWLVDEPEWEQMTISVMDYDTEDGWHVRKYSDGYVEMDKIKEFSSVPLTSWTEGINTATVFNDPDDTVFPIKLTQKLSETASILDTNMIGWTCMAAYNVTPLETCSRYNLARPGGKGNVSGTIGIHITGRWK